MIEAPHRLIGTRLKIRTVSVGPHEQTLTLMRHMDELRRQIGVHYAAD